jgi:phosphoglycolate phosphatase
MIIGFDLDMTLIDSRPGIRASMEALAAESGVAIDVDLVLARLGPKLESELGHWFPPADVARMADRYREHYWVHCFGDGTLLLPGARESIDAVHERGGRVLIVTAKSERLSYRCLDTVGLHAHDVVGHVHGDEKRDALKEHGAQVYVGDTIADVEAGVGAGALTVGVTTGMHDAQQLMDAGATVVLPSLTAFPDWVRRVT